MKYLIYVTKSKPWLFFDKIKNIFSLSNKKSKYDLNGKIVAEFDGGFRLQFRNCLDCKQLATYLNGKTGYAIHIKNLHIFDKPKELSDYFTFTGASNNLNNLKPVKKMVQNMMKVYELKVDRTKYPNILLANYILKPYIIISFDPESARDILNGIKTVDIKNKVLKEMKER